MPYGEAHAGFIPLILIYAHSCFAVRMIYAETKYVLALYILPRAAKYVLALYLSRAPVAQGIGASRQVVLECRFNSGSVNLTPHVSTSTALLETVVWEAEGNDECLREGNSKESRRLTRPTMADKDKRKLNYCKPRQSNTGALKNCECPKNHALSSWFG